MSEKERYNNNNWIVIGNATIDLSLQQNSDENYVYSVEENKIYRVHIPVRFLGDVANLWRQIEFRMPLMFIELFFFYILFFVSFFSPFALCHTLFCFATIYIFFPDSIIIIYL